MTHYLVTWTINIESDDAEEAANQALLEAYNHDGSDSMTDHFDVHFYGSVDFGGTVTERSRDRLTLELRAAGKPRIHLTADCSEVLPVHAAPTEPVSVGVMPWL